MIHAFTCASCETCDIFLLWSVQKFASDFLSNTYYRPWLQSIRRGSMFGLSSWVCFIFLVNFVVVTNQSNPQFDWFCVLVLCEPIILKTFWWLFSLEYSSNFAKLPHNFFVCSYCGKFVCSPPILTELLQRQRQSLSELNPPFILFYFPTSLNPFSLLYLSMSLHLYFSDFEQIY